MPPDQPEVTTRLPVSQASVAAIARPIHRASDLPQVRHMSLLKLAARLLNERKPADATKPKRGAKLQLVRLEKYPRQDSNLRTWLRRPALYPLSYGGAFHDCASVIAHRRYGLRCGSIYTTTGGSRANEVGWRLEDML